MGNRRRLPDNKQRGMNRRKASAKKPMSSQEKEARKKINDANRARTKAAFEKSKTEKK